jgi:DNA polymerase-3 subunit beta
MQLVKTTRDTLLRPLQIVSGIVERRHTMPILANILIRKDGENVSFLSTDTEVQITTHAKIGSGAKLPAPRSPRASCSTSCARCRNRATSR